MTTINLSLTTRLRTSTRVASSAFCTPTPSGWFPVAPGTTLPEPPAPSTNVAPLPPNAAEAPEDWDPTAPDLCWLFQDILPVSAAPVYPTELTVDAVLPPYLETVYHDARVRLGLGITTYPYDLTPVTVSVPLPVHLDATATGVTWDITLLFPISVPVSVTVLSDADEGNLTPWLFPTDFAFLFADD